MNAAVSYVVGSANPHTHLLDVSMTIARAEGLQQVSLPVWIPGSYMVREFSRHLQHLSARQGRRAVGIKQLNKNTWEIDARPGRPLELRYQVYAFDPSVRAAYLDSQRGFFNGTSVCLQAHGLQDQAHEITVQRPKACSEWQAATALQPLQIDARGWGRYRASDYEALIDAPFEWGPFWSGQFMAGGVTHRWVVSGAPASFDGERLLADSQRICAAAIRMWHGRGKPPHRH